MTNLLTETLNRMKNLKKGERLVRWIGSRDGKYVITWEQFKEIAKDYEYNTYCYSLKITPVPEDLVVVFKDDSWLSRVWDDGDIYWVYHELPKVDFFHRNDLFKLPLNRNILSEGS